MTAYPKRILVVDDEPDTRALIWDILSGEGYEICLCASGEQALDRLKKGTFEVILADIKMPGMSGLELLSRVHAIAPGARVILVTAYASLDTAIQAIRGQAFDYLPKPFEMEALQQAVSRALDGRSQPSVRHYDDLTIDLQSRWAWVGGRRIRLTRLEFDTLAHLFEQIGHVVSHEDLIRKVWGYDEVDELSITSVKSCISRLRKKIGDDADNPHYIFNVWGVGYRLGE